MVSSVPVRAQTHMWKEADIVIRRRVTSNECGSMAAAVSIVKDRVAAQAPARAALLGRYLMMTGAASSGSRG